MRDSTFDRSKQRRQDPAQAKNAIVRMVKRPGQRPAFVPHKDPDALLEGLRQIQLGMELAVEDMRGLNVRVCDLIDGAKEHRDELANLIFKYQK
jgi:hypothetical protein